MYHPALTKFFFFLSICVGGHSLSHESSFFIYHHTACFLGLQRYSPRASLRADTMWRHCRKICLLKIGPSINGACDAQLWFSYCFLKIPFKRTRDTLTCQHGGDLFHFQHEASLCGRGCSGGDGGGEVFVLQGRHVTI